mmetsp:Transcript_26971/g.81503  ORF Transcript_26971/g.81503 Transcript_26971/m.81503 type:complete len:266 (-) Transcript_26971:848-1645(-)
MRAPEHRKSGGRGHGPGRLVHESGLGGRLVEEDDAPLLPAGLLAEHVDHRRAPPERVADDLALQPVSERGRDAAGAALRAGDLQRVRAVEQQVVHGGAAADHAAAEQQRETPAGRAVRRAVEHWVPLGELEAARHAREHHAAAGARRDHDAADARHGAVRREKRVARPDRVDRHAAGGAVGAEGGDEGLRREAAAAAHELGRENWGRRARRAAADGDGHAERGGRARLHEQRRLRRFHGREGGLRLVGLLLEDALLPVGVLAKVL